MYDVGGRCDTLEEHACQEQHNQSNGLSHLTAGSVPTVADVVSEAMINVVRSPSTAYEWSYAEKHVLCSNW